MPADVRCLSQTRPPTAASVTTTPTMITTVLAPPPLPDGAGGGILVRVADVVGDRDRDAAYEINDGVCEFEHQSASWTASRNSSTPKDPSRRAATLPVESMVKSHGSSRHAERLQRVPEALLEVVVDVDLLVDELHLVAELLLHLLGDVDDRAADARLA